jgi:hypothetical protein
MGYGRINANEANEQMNSNMMSLTYPLGTAGALMVAAFFLGAGRLYGHAGREHPDVQRGAARDQG